MYKDPREVVLNILSDITTGPGKGKVTLLKFLPFHVRRGCSVTSSTVAPSKRALAQGWGSGRPAHTLSLDTRANTDKDTTANKLVNASGLGATHSCRYYTAVYYN